MKNKLSTLGVENLSIGYKDGKITSCIASNINLTFSEAQLTALVGINGCGKSTLLRTLSGLQKPLSGTVTIARESLDVINPNDLAKRLSVVLTHQSISKNLTVLELVSLGRQPYTNWLGSISQNDKEVVLKTLSETGILNLKNKKCYELSDGQLQRVLIARSMAQDTEIILLDEPMTHLDLHHKASILKLLSQVAHDSGKTVLFSTHDIDYALNYCDTVIVLQDGKVLHKTPEKLIHSGVLETLFPSNNVGFDRENRVFFLR